MNNDIPNNRGKWITLPLYVERKLAEEIKERANAIGISIPEYLRNIVIRDLDENAAKT